MNLKSNLFQFFLHFREAILESIEIFFIRWCDDGFEWFKHFRRVKSHCPSDFRRFREVFEIGSEEEMRCHHMLEEYMIFCYFEPLAHIRIASTIWGDHRKNPISTRYYITDFKLIRKSRWSPPGGEKLRGSPGSMYLRYWKGESANIGKSSFIHRNN